MDDSSDLRDRARRHPAEETLDGIMRMRQEIRRLQVLLAGKCAEAVGLQANQAGLNALARAYRNEVIRLDPKSRLLAADGLYEDGRRRVQADAIYEEAFDAKLRTLAVPGDPSDYRARKADKPT